MQNIKKKPLKRYIDIYRKSDKKLVVTFLYSKEALRQAQHICSCFDFFCNPFAFEVMTGWYNRSDWTTVSLGTAIELDIKKAIDLDFGYLTEKQKGIALRDILKMFGIKKR
jgi:hypothetical protein